ncbi:MAG: hypothetical protein RLZZ169_87, partial [Pseudomonadota bacterium]
MAEPDNSVSVLADQPLPEAHEAVQHASDLAQHSLLARARQEGAQQGELPFAFVAGKAVTDLPKDLYIPPDALEV